MTGLGQPPVMGGGEGKMKWNLSNLDTLGTEECPD